MNNAMKNVATAVITVAQVVASNIVIPRSSSLLYHILVGLEEGLQPRPGDFTADQCDAEYTKLWYEAIQHHWEEAAIFALVPIPFGWISVGGLFGVVRWVRAGFVK